MKLIFVFTFLAIWNVVAQVRIDNLRTDVNRVSNIQIQCADAVDKGYYTPRMMSQCIDDYIRSR